MDFLKDNLGVFLKFIIELFDSILNIIRVYSNLYVGISFKNFLMIYLLVFLIGFLYFLKLKKDLGYNKIGNFTYLFIFIFFPFYLINLLIKYFEGIGYIGRIKGKIKNNIDNINKKISILRKNRNIEIELINIKNLNQPYFEINEYIDKLKEKNKNRYNEIEKYKSLNKDNINDDIGEIIGNINSILKIKFNNTKKRLNLNKQLMEENKDLYEKIDTLRKRIIEIEENIKSNISIDDENKFIYEETKKNEVDNIKKKIDGFLVNIKGTDLFKTIEELNIIISNNDIELFKNINELDNKLKFIFSNSINDKNTILVLKKINLLRNINDKKIKIIDNENIFLETIDFIEKEYENFYIFEKSKFNDLYSKYDEIKGVIYSLEEDIYPIKELENNIGFYLKNIFLVDLLNLFLTLNIIFYLHVFIFIFH